jgi:predicted phosphodiesterase
MRTLILSDTHMAGNGQGAGSAAALRPLWHGMDRVIINGDTAETRNTRGQARALQRIADLRELAEADGVELTLIAGNHDPFVVDRDWLELHGGAVVLTHGDLLHPQIAPWSDGAEELATLRRQELEARAADPDAPALTEDAAATKHAAARHWRKVMQDRYTRRQTTWIGRRWRQVRTVWSVLYYWTVMPQRAKRFAAEHFPDCRFFLFGHIHRPGVWHDGDRVIINTGSFHLPRRPRAVILGPDELTFWKIEPDADGGHRLADQPLQRFRL